MSRKEMTSTLILAMAACLLSASRCENIELEPDIEDGDTGTGNVTDIDIDIDSDTGNVRDRSRC